MLTITQRSGVLPVLAGRRPARGRAVRLLRIAAARAGRLLASWRRKPVEPSACDFAEAGTATLRDLGLLDTHPCTPYDLVDIEPGLESTRMRLFVMTGQYWRGS